MALYLVIMCMTWVTSYKKKFVKAWSDKEMHLGNKTSNMYVNSHQTHLFDYKELLIFGLI